MITKKLSFCIHRFLTLWIPHYCSVCYHQLKGHDHIFCSDCKIKMDSMVYLRPVKRYDIFMIKTWDNFITGIDYYQFRSFYNILGAIKFQFKKFQLDYLINLLLKDIHLLESCQVTHITYMPLSFRKTIIRGFNPSYEIAKALSKVLGAPCIKMFKKIETIAQSKKSRSARLASFLKPSFKILKKLDLHKESRVLVVDDVLTTGVTTSTIGLLLKKHYDCHVIGFTLFDANPQKRYKDLLEKAATAKSLSE